MRIALLALASGCSRKCDRSGSESADIGIRAAAFTLTCSGSRVNRRRGYGSRRRMYRATAAGDEATGPLMKARGRVMKGEFLIHAVFQQIGRAAVRERRC